MKEPQPDLYNRRVIYLAGRFISLPFTIALDAYRWAMDQLRRLRSDKTIRHEDQVRQSKVRRELRGLPADSGGGRPSRR